MKIHPRAACGLFVILYCLIGLFFWNIYDINLFGKAYFTIIGSVLTLIVHLIFGKKYYEGNDDE